MASLHDWFDFVPTPPDLPTGKEHHVSITFRPEQRPWVLYLKESLQYAGFLVRLDQAQQSLEFPVRSALDRGILSSVCCILVLSKEQDGTAWQRAEQEAMMRAANDSGSQYVPLLIDESSLAAPVESHPVSFVGRVQCPHGEGLVRTSHALLGQEPSEDGVKFAREVDRQLEEGLREIEAMRKKGTRRDLVAISESESTAWSSFPALRCRVAEALIEKGTYDEAIGVLDRVQKHHSLNIRSKQIRGWIASKQGDFVEAARVFAELVAEGSEDPVTLEYIARFWLDQYYHSREVDSLRKARGYIATALLIDETADSVAGLGAVVSALLQEPEVAQAYVRRLALGSGAGKPRRLDFGPFEERATAADSHLICGEVDKAIAEYRAALDEAPRFPSSVSSLGYQAMRLLDALLMSEPDRVRVKAVFESVL